ncbi:uncharacterized protein LOC135214671 [Macrobrachium nipponense]|uniref:uncharacterized protein LOC135214671 n=1 Tax=Macrobrachium nipponense TaxID=159736 RepID=UPI0030C8C679
MKRAKEAIWVGVLILGINLTIYILPSQTDITGWRQSLASHSQKLLYAASEEFHPKDVTAIERSKKPMFILLLCSSGRSGSTFVAELLGTRGNSVVFYEPLFKTVTEQKLPCHVNGTCIPEYLKSIAACDYTQEFEDWFKEKTLFYSYFHTEVTNCFVYADNKKKCKMIDVRGKCRNSVLRVIKVIRSRVAWVEGLLKDDSLNFKFIYLTRDPRATLASYVHMGWKNTPSAQCSTLHQDLVDFERLAKLYPNKAYQLEVEKLSADPTTAIPKLFDFLFGSPEIHDETMAFVMTHMFNNVSTSFGLNTAAYSSEEYQAWRWEITEQLLNETEKEPVCNSVLKMLRHEVFGSLKRARDKGVPLFNHAK